MLLCARLMLDTPNDKALSYRTYFFTIHQLLQLYAAV